MDAPAHGSGEKAREPMQTQKKNGKWRQKTISTIAALLSVLVVCAVVPSLGSVADQLSILSAAFLLPDGTSALFASDPSSKQPPDAAPATSDTSSAQPAQTPAPSGSESGRQSVSDTRLSKPPRYLRRRYCERRPSFWSFNRKNSPMSPFAMRSSDTLITLI